MTRLSGAAVVLPDRVLEPGTVVIEGGLITEVRPGRTTAPEGDEMDLTGHVVVPGFIDVHVHGVEGFDTLATEDAARALARRMPRYGVTAFCPTTVACPPGPLARLLEGIRQARTAPEPGSARVLPAHLESNFINPDFRGAQPLSCLRLPTHEVREGVSGSPPFSGREILDTIAAAREQVGILTIAPELAGGLDLIRSLVAAGHIVSLGHSAANYEESLAGIEAGARHATHLFNRMTPLSHRAPGLPGALFERTEMRAEIVCDGYHVHPTVVHAAIAVLGRDRAMAITDGTAGAGLPVGTEVPLGSHTITVRPEAAFLPDGTLAGSTLTMDGAFRMLVRRLGLGLVDAAHLCATTQARQLKLTHQGRIEPGAAADITVLDADLRPVATWVDGVRWGP